MKELLNKIIEKLFEKKIPKVRYIEKRIEIDTECDTCECLDKCKEESIVVECASYEDTRSHYICGRGGCCKEVLTPSELLMHMSDGIGHTEALKKFGIDI